MRCNLWKDFASEVIEVKVFREYQQNQRFLLPPALDEFVPEDHEVRTDTERKGRF